MLNLHLEIVQLGLQLGIMYKLTSLTYTPTWQSKRQLRLRARQRSGGTGLDRAGRSGGRRLKGRPLSLKPVGVALRSVPLPPLSQAPHTIALGTLEARVVAHVSRQIVNRVVPTDKQTHVFCGVPVKLLPVNGLTVVLQLLVEDFGQVSAGRRLPISVGGRRGHRCQMRDEDFQRLCNSSPLVPLISSRSPTQQLGPSGSISVHSLFLPLFYCREHLTTSLYLVPLKSGGAGKSNPDGAKLRDLPYTSHHPMEGRGRHSAGVVSTFRVFWFEGIPSQATPSCRDCTTPIGIGYYLLKEDAMTRGPNGEKRPGDVVGCAVTVAKIATGEIEEELSAHRAGKVNGGKARTSGMTAEERSEFASAGARARWGKGKE